MTTARWARGRRRWGTGAASAAALLLAVTACGSGDDASPAATDTAGTESATAKATESAATGATSSSGSESSSQTNGAGSSSTTGSATRAGAAGAASATPRDGAGGNGGDGDDVDEWPSAGASGAPTASPSNSYEKQYWPAASKTATAFMKAYARPKKGTDASEWWDKAKGYLTAKAQQEYAGADPQNIPFAKVTGPASVTPLMDVPQDLDLPVKVPTDAGVFTVHVSDDQDGVKVTTLEFPDGVH